MKKLLTIAGLDILAGSLWADNVVFNPGFDMTPWDTGWTREYYPPAAPYGIVDTSFIEING